MSDSEKLPPIGIKGNQVGIDAINPSIQLDDTVKMTEEAGDNKNKAQI